MSKDTPIYRKVSIMSWTDINTERSQSKSEIRNLKLASGPNGAEREYIVRFVGEPITFYKYFINNKSAIVEDPINNPIKKKYTQDPPGTRHAINLIYREASGGDGQIYLSEVAPSVLKPVAAWAKRRKMNPGGEIAVDFSIVVRGQKKDTRYEVVPLEQTTLTDAEKAMKPYDLAKLFKPTPNEELEARLGYVDASATAKTAVTTVTTAPAGGAKAVDLPF